MSFAKMMKQRDENDRERWQAAIQLLQPELEILQGVANRMNEAGEDIAVVMEAVDDLSLKIDKYHSLINTLT